MAKNDNLTDLLTDVANAIRAKKGISGKINPQNFSSEIASISTGSGGGEGGGGALPIVIEKDVNFRDYDGTLLHSYTKEQFLALSELPELPTRPGLICQEWNWDIARAKNHVQECGMLEIGASYITDDGNTRLYISIASKAKRDIRLYLTQIKANQTIVDWGDGSSETISVVSGYTSHTYPSEGDYIIVINPNGSTSLSLGIGQASGNVIGGIGNQYRTVSSMLKKVELGIVSPNINAYAFRDCFCLEAITIPSNVTYSGNYAFKTCYSLASIVFPRNFQTMGTYMFQQCYALKHISLNAIGAISNQGFNQCNSLGRIIIPNSVSSIGSYAFANCNGNEVVVMPNSVTSIGTYAFQNNASLRFMQLPDNLSVIPQYFCSAAYSLASIKFPKSITSISASAFAGNQGMILFDFSLAESVPTLANPNAFNNGATGRVFVVPDELYDEWVAATNWSSYKIVKASEYTE